MGRAPGRYVGRHTKFSAIEIAWLRDNCTMVISAYHQAFCAQFNRADITAANLHSLRKREGWKTGRDGHFNKGAVPANKGKKMPFNANSARTQFKKGRRTGVAAVVYKPIGSERTHESGYRERKVHDGLPMQSRWKFVHRIEWEQAHGPVPEGMVLKCKGDRLDTDPSNWELVPRGLLPRLNGRSGRGYDGAPDDLRPTIMAVAKLEHRVREKKTRRSMKREPAHGCRRSPDQQRQVVVRLDDDTFDLVRARAVREGTSFGEQVRTLITWGLEAEENV